MKNRILSVSLFALSLTFFHVRAQEASPNPAADPEVAALAGFDEETGLWFPPNAPRQVYLDGTDPKHNLIRDIQEAFKTDVALRKSVCALMADPKRQVDGRNLSPMLRQKRSMFDLMCIGLASQEEEQARQAAARKQQQAQWETWMNIASARELEPEERTARTTRLQEELRPASSEGSFERAFTMFGLSPQNDFVLYKLLKSFPYPSAEKAEAEVLAFVRGVIERESAAGKPDAIRWRMALRNLLLYRGEYREARTVAASIVESSNVERWRTGDR
ncbi:MAG TPA: hypothetical protein VGR00_12840, partial [Thermoanaerobaculia bacterium]|nr:hypothetical protein [Thermoanaerobaculia bacterium]